MIASVKQRSLVLANPYLNWQKRLENELYKRRNLRAAIAFLKIQLVLLCTLNDSFIHLKSKWNQPLLA